ncbi:alpha/beta hydrolase [Caulobacter sp. BE254]|uniref:alpha/beta fold hydrolase n=1 Tax=Caulobacter sp. BE254 TaxID=2817720 RepID=UPI00285ABE56|nr:alpha/beta hydrolase [Caulobacter sp. BE254]MDR7115552.1 pimeloyl-ACP methyl ester carboxylesterase [Caulobacter sp. BE254]
MSPAPVLSDVVLRRAEVGEVSVFYRQAGDPERPAILLLHGFPTSSHQFRDLIPRLADRYHVIAPDLPGFGFTTVAEGFDYSFAKLAEVMAAFTDAIGLTRYAIYVFDYGAPVGLRLALARPDAVTAIVSQNGNAYEEGLSDGWAPTRAYWADPSPANRETMRGMLTLEATRWQYTHGAPDETQVAPEAYWLDYALMSRPGNDDIQLKLIADYVSNVALYPRIHDYFRTRKPPLLAVWGAGDPFFLPAGAEAFRRDLPEAEVHFLDAGHFALETHGREIADLMRDFLGRHLT